MEKEHILARNIGRTKKGKNLPFHRHNGYIINGDKMKSCISIAKYHECPKHCNKNVTYFSYGALLQVHSFENLSHFLSD